MKNLKKLFSWVLVLSMVMVLTSGMVSPVYASINFGTTKLIDVAYSDTLKVFVAVGNDGTVGKIYTSTNGLNWILSKSDATQLGSYSNDNASVIWWPSQSMFVVHQKTTGKIYTSIDGYTWVQPNQQYYGSGISSDGNALWSYDNNTVTKYTDLNTKVDTLVQTSGDAWLGGLYCNLGAPNPAYLAVVGYYGWYSLDSGANWISKSPLAGGYGTVVGAVYSNNINQFVEIVSTQGWSMNLMDRSGNISFGAMNGTNGNRATSITTSGSRFVMGLNDGTIYTATDDSNFTGETTWTQSVKAQGVFADNAIKMNKICFGNGYFVGVGNNGTTSEILKISEDGSNYQKASEHVNQAPVVNTTMSDKAGNVDDSTINVDLSSVFSDPDGDNLVYLATSSNTLVATVTTVGSMLAIAQTGVGSSLITVTANDGGGGTVSTSFNITSTAKGTSFGSTLLTGVAYSDPLKLYVAIGNDGNIGKIYTSADGLNWTLTKGDAIKLGIFSKNIIWWTGENKFVVLVSNTKIYTSVDGYNWVIESPGLQYGGIASDGNRMISFGENKFDVYNSLTDVTAHSPTTNTGVYLTNAVSDGAITNPTYLAIRGYYGWISNDGGSTWSDVSHFVPGWGDVADVIYSSNAGKFIGTSSVQGWAVTTISKNGSVDGNELIGTDFSASNRANCIATSGSKIVVGMQSGKIYTAIDDANFGSSTTFTQVNKAIALNSDNIVPIKSVCYGNGKFVAVGNNGINSEVLLINADGSSYLKASTYLSLLNFSNAKLTDGTNSLTSLTAGQNAIASVDVINKGAILANAKMLVAIYSSSNELKQIVFSDEVLSGQPTQTLSKIFNLNQDIGVGCYAKIFVWDSIAGMKTYITATKFCKN